MSKKDSLASTLGAGAGELANFFDKLKKKSSSTAIASSASSNSSLLSPTQPAECSSPNKTQSESSASSIISNLAINLSKRVLSDQKTASLNTSKPNLSLSKLLNDENEDQDLIGESLPKSEGSPLKSPHMPSSQSEYDFNTRKNRSSITSSSSMTESLNKASENPTIEPTPKSDAIIEQKTAIKKLPASSSLQRISSVFDGVVDSAQNEADQLRKRILTKKKSIECTLENMKQRMSASASANQSLNTTLENNRHGPGDDVFALPFELSSDQRSNFDCSNGSPRLEQSADTPDLIDFDDAGPANHTLQSSTSSNNLSAYVKPVEQKKRAHSIGEHKNLLIGILVANLAFFAMMPKSLSFIFVFYAIGLASGVSATGILCYFAIKLDLIKYILKENSSSDSNSTNENSDANTSNADPNDGEKKVIEEIQSFLLQTAVYKENKNFDGVYKVILH
jgi:hypothetical protein